MNKTLTVRKVEPEETKPEKAPTSKRYKYIDGKRVEIDDLGNPIEKKRKIRLPKKKKERVSETKVTKI